MEEITHGITGPLAIIVITTALVAIAPIVIIIPVTIIVSVGTTTRRTSVIIIHGATTTPIVPIRIIIPIGTAATPIVPIRIIIPIGTTATPIVPARIIILIRWTVVAPATFPPMIVIIAYAKEIYGFSRTVLKKDRGCKKASKPNQKKASIHFQLLQYWKGILACSRIPLLRKGIKKNFFVTLPHKRQLEEELEISLQRKNFSYERFQKSAHSIVS